MKKGNRPRGYLKEPKNLIYDFKQRAKEGKALSPYKLEQEDQSLYSAIMREFDSFDDFLLQAGFKPEKIRVQQRWTLDKIKNELDLLYNNEIEINYHNKSKNYDKTQHSVFRMLIYFFENIEDGLNSFNYTLSNHYLERICPKCKKNIINRNENRVICEECK